MRGERRGEKYKEGIKEREEKERKGERRPRETRERPE